MYKHKKLDILQLPVKSSLEHIQISSELAARLVPQEVKQLLLMSDQHDLQLHLNTNTKTDYHR